MCRKGQVAMLANHIQIIDGFYTIGNIDAAHFQSTFSTIQFDNLKSTQRLISMFEFRIINLLFDMMKF